MVYTFKVTPVPKPRMTRSDKWNTRPIVQKYRDFADLLRGEAKQQKFTLSDSFRVLFLIPMPQSWSQKKREEMSGKPHQLAKSNDIDNLLKSVMDVLRPEEDGKVYKVEAEKRWNTEGVIIIYC